MKSTERGCKWSFGGIAIVAGIICLAEGEVVMKKERLVWKERLDVQSGVVTPTYCRRL